MLVQFRGVLERVVLLEVLDYVCMKGEGVLIDCVGDWPVRA